MEITDALASLIVQRVDVSVMREQAIKDGMNLLIQDGIRNVKDGRTTVEEILSVAHFEQPIEEVGAE